MCQPDQQQPHRAPKVQAGERFPRSLGAHQHHREAHPEQQREQRPELAAHERVDEGIRHPRRPRQPRVDAGGDVQQRPAEELDVHQEDPEQRDATQDVEQLDAFGRPDGRQHRVVHGIGLPAGGRPIITQVSGGGRLRRARGRARVPRRWPRALPRPRCRSAGPCPPSGGSGRRRPRSCPPCGWSPRADRSWC